MELNIAPLNNTLSVASRSLKEKQKPKGSWRKRRREQVVQRAKEEKRLGKKFQTKRNSAANQIQADEFESGIEKKTNETEQKLDPKEPIRKRARPNNKNKATFGKNVDGFEKKIEEQSFPSDDNNHRGIKERQRTESNYKVDRSDQTPQAVNATLAVVGDSPVNKDKSANDEIGKPGEQDDANVQKDTDNAAMEEKTFENASFADTGLYHSIVHHLAERLEMKLPTKVQEKVLKAMLNLPNGQQSIDILIRSATGSGKTLAYLLPIIHYLLQRKRRVTREDGTLAIVVVPTRELADQVHEVASLVCRPWHWIVVGSVVGGESKKREKARLRKGINLLIATPGRILDHMRNTQSFIYGFCEFLVLDEADRLLDLGFEGEIRELIQSLDNQAKISNPGAEKNRSNLLLSATLRNDVQKLAKLSLREPIEIAVNTEENQNDAAFSMPFQLKQYYSIVEQRYRLVTLACFLRLRALKGMNERISEEADNDPSCKIIVFFSTCDSVDFHYELFQRVKLPSELRGKNARKDQAESFLPLELFRIHGNHTQADRSQSLKSFRKSNRAILFCTDVASRGLDLKGLTFSVQYDPPTGGQGEELEYLHRAGRTARMGSRGDALLFLLPSERAYVGKLESKGVSISEISGSAALAALYPNVDLSNQGSISYATRLVTSAVQENFEAVIERNEELKQQAVAGYQAYCRAYATHAKEVRYFFHVRNLHLGHVARAFVLGDKPAELKQMMSDIRNSKSQAEARAANLSGRDTKRKGDIARAIAEGEKQPYNDQSTTLARRRREKGRGLEAMREMALEFGA